MILGGNIGRLVRSMPHVPGVDFAGTVAPLVRHPLGSPGDKVVLTGWRVGSAPGRLCPEGAGQGRLAGAAARRAVGRPAPGHGGGNAGVAAILAVLALEDHGARPGNGPVLVTGAAGGVGSVAVAMLAKLLEVAGSTGRPNRRTT